MRLIVGLAVGLMLVQVIVVGMMMAATTNLPGGEIVAYVSDGGTSASDIFVVDINTGLSHNLTDNMGSSCESDPAWSPDGSQIVFTTSNQPCASSYIFLMDMDGGNQHQVTPHEGYDPIWSPDGRQIAFLAFQANSGPNIYLVDTNGSHLRKLNNTAFNQTSPAWSPDGGSIAFHSFREGIGDSIYVIDADGRNEQELIQDFYRPAWSPDGSRIALLHTADHSQITVMELDTGALQSYNIPAANITAPAGLRWLPDSQYLAIVTHPVSGPSEVYLLDTDSGNYQRFPFGGYRDNLPVWRPG